MSRTIRREPSSGSYMRRQHHIAYKRSEEASYFELTEECLKPSNRHKCYMTRIADPWNDKIISYYRGQKWDRAYKAIPNLYFESLLRSIQYS